VRRIEAKMPESVNISRNHGQSRLFLLCASGLSPRDKAVSRRAAEVYSESEGKITRVTSRIVRRDQLLPRDERDHNDRGKTMRPGRLRLQMAGRMVSPLGDGEVILARR
jgi:hypothetical protein